MPRPCHLALLALPALLAPTASAFHVAPHLSISRACTRAHRPATPVTPRAAPPLALQQLPASSLLAFDFPLSGVSEVAAVVAAAILLTIVLAGKGSLEAGAALMLLFFQGDPDEREKSGANEGGLLVKLALAVTPSAWKKAYAGENDVDRAEGEEPPKLDLPAWQGEEARQLVEEEAVACVKSMQLAPIEVPSVGPVDTCYISLAPKGNPADAPPLMLIHGFDSSVLEFRYITDALTSAGLRVEAMEWWTGGFTARAPFEQAVREGGAKPWDLIREHQYAFLKRQLDGQKVVLLGASLGGAVALDFAATYPECVAGMILMDAGGESYAQPEPFLTSLAADPVTNLFQWRATNGLLPYPHVWSKEDSWRSALRAYLKSGGYQSKVGPELIRTVSAPTLVLWGEEDDVLPVADAYKYQQDLPNCVGVTLIPDAQHAPALENPSFVAEQIISFAKSKVWEQTAAAAA
ncbi:hypothetical protein AB1Y20_019542 [Prymnesium parvum]|uniref:AB hydrolase-1 domain-containing protein n=1 Tax=Prymnesium parvum TaxID=97485 RepID=A0AB34JS29_PRYPA